MLEDIFTIILESSCYTGAEIACKYIRIWYSWMNFFNHSILIYVIGLATLGPNILFWVSLTNLWSLSNSKLFRTLSKLWKCVPSTSWHWEFVEQKIEALEVWNFLIISTIWSFWGMIRLWDCSNNLMMNKVISICMVWHKKKIIIGTLVYSSYYSRCKLLG